MASYKIYTNSEKAWEGMFAAIASARKSIYLEMYIFHTDTEGFNFLAELEKSVRRGVRVIIVLDILGSRLLDKEAVARLRAAGAEVLFYSFFLSRTHRKILVVDEEVAFIGGVNIRRKYASWRDLHIKVSGAVVRPIVRSFARVYRRCGGKTTILSDKPRSMFYRTKLWFLERGVGRNKLILRRYYEGRISRAKCKIVVVTPYLLPPRWLLAQLHQAILRGVSLEFILPSATDHRLANRVNFSFAAFFSGAGAKCYFLPGMNHAKAMLIDDREGVIGSQNLDFISFDWSIEAGVFFSDPLMVRDLSKIIDDWKRQAQVFDLSRNKFRWYDIPVAFLLRLFGFLPI